MPLFLLKHVAETEIRPPGVRDVRIMQVERHRSDGTVVGILQGISIMVGESVLKRQQRPDVHRTPHDIENPCQVMSLIHTITDVETPDDGVGVGGGCGVDSDKRKLIIVIAAIDLASDDVSVEIRIVVANHETRIDLRDKGGSSDTKMIDEAEADVGDGGPDGVAEPFMKLKVGSQSLGGRKLGQSGWL